MRNVLAFIQGSQASDADGIDAGFNALALKLFAHQFRHNLPFQRFCIQRGKTIRVVKHWHDIPAVPIDAFKELTLSCQSPDVCERVFMTSGTTRADVKGRHYHPALAVYDRSMSANFRQGFMAGHERLRMGILFPTEPMMPNSSLAHYLALALGEFGAPGSRYFVGPMGLETDALIAFLRRAQQGHEPVGLLGASFSFVHLMDALAQRGESFQMPSGSRLLDTGGFKGQSREMPMDTFYQRLSVALGIGRGDCINMYGMTELSTQFYDRGNASVPSVKRGPPWIRSRVLDPVTGLSVPQGERGILAHCDLGNFNSVTTVLTEDVGIAVDDGFLLLGRAEGAQAKGCSVAVDEFLRAATA